MTEYSTRIAGRHDDVSPTCLISVCSTIQTFLPETDDEEDDDDNEHDTEDPDITLKKPGTTALPS